ncbi:hypothetical protein IM40_09720 (plasmid) [Candidatus Paracaedimonas acanthamoebae]|nr:hypothetical protein IM40_09720 [Candidatus Paracaedimonas acanthamoebae]
MRKEDLDEEEAQEREIAIKNELIRKSIILSDETIKSIAKDLLPIVSFDLNSTHLNYLIETIEEISLLERRQFIDTLVELLNDTLHTIEVLYDLPYDQVKDIMGFFSTLATTERSTIIGKLKQVSSEDRIDVIRYLPSLWNKEMTVEDKAKIIKSISNIAREERAGIVSCISFLPNKSLNGSNISQTIDSLARIPVEQRLDMIKLIIPLWHEKMDQEKIASLINSLTYVAIEQRSEMVKHITPFWNENMYGSEVSEIIHSLNNTPVEKRSKIINCILPLWNKKMGGLKVACSILYLAIFPCDEYPENIKRHIKSSICNKDFIEKIQFLVSQNISRTRIKRSDDSGERIIEYESYIPISLVPGVEMDMEDAFERDKTYQVLATFTEQEQMLALSLWTEKMSSNEKYLIIDALRDFAPQERPDILRSLPFLWNDNLNGLERSYIITALAKAHPEKRVSIANYASFLLNDNMDGYERSKVIEILSNIDVMQIEELANIFQKHINDIDKNDWLKVLFKIKEFPPEERIKVSKIFILLWSATKENNTIQNLSDLCKNITKAILKEGGGANLFQIVGQAGY